MITLDIRSTKMHYIAVSVFCIMVFFLSARSVFAQSAAAGQQFGAGVVIGAPTGFTFRYALSANDRLDCALAWSVKDDERFYIHAGYNRFFYGLIPLSPGALPVYAGAGLRVLDREDDNNGKDDDDKDRIGVRVPVGVQYEFAGVPVEVFLELGLIVDMYPETGADLTAGLGVRYCF